MDEKKVRQQIKNGSIISFLLVFLNVVLGLVYTPWILHEVGSSNYGLYTLAGSLTAMLLMDFGMSAAITRFIAKYRAEDNQENIDAFVGLSIKFFIIICSIAAVILFIVFFNIETIYSKLSIEEISTFKIVFVITSFFIVICFPVNICNGILNAYEEFSWLKGSDVLNKIGTVVVTIIALICHGGIYSLVFINGLFNLFTLIIKCYAVKRKTPVKICFSNNKKLSLKEIFSFSIWSTINGVSQKLIFNIIPSILAGIANTLAITLYGFANVIEGYVYSISSALNGLFMPKVSRIVVSKTEATDVLPLMIKVGRINLSIIYLLIMGLTIFGKEFVRLWIGEEYSSLYYCILFLIYPYFISSSQQIANTSIIVLNKVKHSALIGIATGVLNVILCFLLCPLFGVVGVCAGTGFSFIVRIICLNYVYYKTLKIDIANFFVHCHIKMLPAFVVSATFSFVITKIWTNPYSGVKGWAVLGVRAIIVSLIYLGVMWIIGFNKEEKGIVRSIFSR